MTNARNLSSEVEALKAAYAALNRNDVAGFVACFDPEVERIEPPEFPLGGIYRGLAAVTAHVAQGRGSWAEGSCEPERFVTAGDRVVVIIHVRVRLKTETEWREGRIADGFTFRAGKAVLFRTFAEERQALAWAGIAAPPHPQPLICLKTSRRPWSRC